MNHLVLYRGLPGGGKSTAAQILLGKIEGWVNARDPEGIAVLNSIPSQPKSSAYCSADDFFVGDDGVYRFNGRKIGMAHAECQTNALKAMAEGVGVVVIDNTHTQVWEYALYLAMGNAFHYKITIIDLFDARFTDEELAVRNSHGIPFEAIRNMRKRYEICETDIRVDVQLGV